MRRLARGLVERARAGRVTLATAESCTGGLLAHLVTGVAGCSDVYAGGVVAYSNRVKEGLLGVRGESLAAFGAVSREVAGEMAEGARRACGASVAVSTTGVAGPGGGSRSKPVGTVWFGLAAEGGVETWKRRFAGNRHEIQARAAKEALERLRRHCELQ